MFKSKSSHEPAKMPGDGQRNLMPFGPQPIQKPIVRVGKNSKNSRVIGK